MNKTNVLLCVDTILIVFLILWVFYPQSTPAYLEVKYVIYNANSFEHIEVVGVVYVNGCIDYNNRLFQFSRGSSVVLSCPEKLYGAKFSFWQRQEGLTYQGLIITNRTFTTTLSDYKTQWWANYVKDD